MRAPGRAARAAIVAVVVLGSIGVVGMAGTAGAAGAKTPPPPEGYVATVIKAGGITIALPKTWLALDPKSPQSASELQHVADQNPNLTSLVSQFARLRSSIKFWAIDAAATSFAGNVLVLPTPFDPGIVKQPSSVKDALAQSLGDTATAVSSRKVKVAGVNAVETDATLSITNTAGDPITVYATIYLVPTKKGVVDLDFSSDQPTASDTRLHTMVSSIRLL